MLLLRKLWISCIVWIHACAADHEARGMSDAELRGQLGDAQTDVVPPPILLGDAGSPRDRSCRFQFACQGAEACRDGMCALTQSCERVEYERVFCMDWDLLLQPSSWHLQQVFEGRNAPALHVDGGAAALGNRVSFRCPETYELLTDVGGEATGFQPICGPEAKLADLSDAGRESALCCYGMVLVAGF